MIKKVAFLILFATTLFVSCCRFDDVVTAPVITSCNKMAIVDTNRFNQTPTTNYTITNVVLNGDCLKVTISSSGCDPNNWDMNFIASENVMESFPVQRSAKVQLVNDEACLAVFQKTMSFDLIPLRVQGQNQVQIHLQGWSTSIMYQY